MCLVLLIMYHDSILSSTTIQGSMRTDQVSQLAFDGQSLVIEKVATIW